MKFETYTRYSWVADEKKVLVVLKRSFLSSLVGEGNSLFIFFKEENLKKKFGKHWFILFFTTNLYSTSRKKTLLTKSLYLTINFFLNTNLDSAPHWEQVCHQRTEPWGEARLSDEPQFEFRQAYDVITPFDVPWRDVQQVGFVVVVDDLGNKINIF